MSLKAFHIFFIVVSIIFTAGFGVWGLREQATSHSGAHLALGVGGLIAAAALVVYLIAFLRKMRDPRIS